ncbi:hypothetical protein AC578_10537 [Pseudocercospora eumusae]|uniref:Uncharacterized protein n=1 Tax=Pseudocercospora eumusae TaxID=321146 RepID=A0A139H5R7_9PEZI|nr:hypothetical protein AC578_10537 [Pseudocercospora eumusae]
MSCDSLLDREPLPEDGHNHISEDHASGERAPTNLLQTHRRGTLSYIDEHFQTLHDQTSSQLHDIRQRHEYLLERCAMIPFSRRGSFPELHDAVSVYVPQGFRELEAKLERAFEMARLGQSGVARRMVGEVEGCLGDLEDRNFEIGRAMERLVEEGVARAL